MSENSSEDSENESEIWNSDDERNIERRNSRGAKRNHWLTEEDNAIITLVKEYGTREWKKVAKMVKQKYGIKRRSAKQCRERWHNHLDPKINKDPISNEEERKIFEFHKIHGNKWAKIAGILNGRTDNQIKNQFYSTLRRQLRKINKLLISENFQNMMGGKLSEITADELYKYIKDNIVDYDDIKGIYSKALDCISENNIKMIKLEAIEEVRIDKQNEIQTNKFNRRSYRLSKKSKKDEDEEYEITKVGVLVLFKLLRKFREDNKDKLDCISSQVSKESGSNKVISKDSTKNEYLGTNKRKIKEERKAQNNIVENADKNEKFKDKYTIKETNLVPQRIRSLFSKMKDKEDPNCKNNLNRSEEKFDIKIEKDNESPDSIREFIIKDAYSQKDISKISDVNQFNIGRYFPEESDPGKFNYNQFLNVNISPHKKINFQDGEREVSNNSNLSHSFAPFSNNNQMNLSRPTDLNFDTFNMLPSNTNFACNMLNKIVDYSQNNTKQIQFNVNYCKNNSRPDSEINSVQRIDIQNINNLINLNFSPNKRIIIEMVDDCHMEIRTTNKEVPNTSLFMNKDDYFKESSASKFCMEVSNPMGVLPSLPNEMFNSNKFGVYVSKLRSSGSKNEQDMV